MRVSKTNHFRPGKVTLSFTVHRPHYIFVPHERVIIFIFCHFCHYFMLTWRKYIYLTHNERRHAFNLSSSRLIERWSIRGGVCRRHFGFHLGVKPEEFAKVEVDMHQNEDDTFWLANGLPPPHKIIFLAILLVAMWPDLVHARVVKASALHAPHRPRCFCRHSFEDGADGTMHLWWYLSNLVMYNCHIRYYRHSRKCYHTKKNHRIYNKSGRMYTLYLHSTLRTYLFIVI